ncbi:MAG: cob(I)yrinic acid a,c-diamide adenosyltransferase [Steroidobacteraceae bacterium]
MGNRLSKIVTRTGDAGTTGLGDGSRVRKDDARIEAIGAVDELNSAAGLLRAGAGLPEGVPQCLLRIQHDLFDLGGELAVPGMRLLNEAQVDWLETQVEHFNAGLPPLKEFILPGGSEIAARCHLARSIARRAERRCWTLAATQSPEERGIAPVYLNRLSDLLFVLSRVLARCEGGSEVLWDRSRID